MYDIYMHIKYMWTYFLKYTELKSLGMKDLGHVLFTVLHMILIKQHDFNFQVRF